MTRTPLAGRLQQLYRDYELHEVTGTPLDIIQAVRAVRPSRRDFLKIAATAAAGVALRPSWSAAAQQPRITIVGGGIAGLNAALTLQDAGVSATIYEASPRFGGRMHSDTTTWANGQVSEKCGELIDSSHETILGLAKRFKIGVADVRGAEPRNSTDTYFFSGSYYSLDAANADFEAVYRALKKDVKAAGYPTLYNSYNAAGYALDHMSVHDWIASRVPGGHGSRMGQLLDVAYNIEYGAETSDQSALNLVYLLGFQPRGSAFEIFGESDERYHLVGGNEGLPKAIAAVLPSQNLRAGAALARIVQNADGTFSLRFTGKGGAFTVVADRVILAIPFSVLRTLDYDQAGFTPGKRLAIEELGAGTNAKLNLQFDRRLWNEPGPWGPSNGGSYSDTGAQSTWDVTRAQKGRPGILVNYTGGAIGASFTGNPGNAKIVTSYATAFLDQIEHVFPGITAEWNGRAALDTPASNPLFLGSYSYWRVGQYTQFAGIERQPSGQCYFAGEHCSTDFQGFMEGAAREGARAAKEVLASG
jgi:monoamine oxidase